MSIKMVQIQRRYFNRENREINSITIVQEDYDDNIRANRYIHPVKDPWIVTLNLLLQTNNDEKKCMARLPNLGYQYVNRTYAVRRCERKLKRMVNKLTSGIVRKEGIRLNGLVDIIQRNIDISIVIFREIHVEYDPEPKVTEPSYDKLTSGYMRNGEIYIYGLHKMVLKYIDTVPGIYLQWDRTCSFGGGLLQGNTELTSKDFEDII